MLKKTITYVDFAGIQRTEDFYFNLTDAELAQFELRTEGGFKEMIERITNAKSQLELVELFDRLIMASYGVKSADGRRFVKNDAVREEFRSTQAYSDLYMELVTDSKKAADFFNAIVTNRKTPAVAVAPTT